jgi:hypothetical protein
MHWFRVASARWLVISTSSLIRFPSVVSLALTPLPRRRPQTLGGNRLAEARVLALHLLGALDPPLDVVGRDHPSGHASVFVEHEQAGYDGPQRSWGATPT